MNAKHIAHAVEHLAISLAVYLQCAKEDLRGARARGWCDPSHSLWELHHEHERTVYRAARALRDAYHAARQLGAASEFLAACRRVMASGRKGQSGAGH